MAMNEILNCGQKRGERLPQVSVQTTMDLDDAKSRKNNRSSGGR